MDQLSNVLQIHSHQQDMMASHPHYQYLDNINLISSTSKQQQQQQQSTPPHQDSHHQQTPQPPSDKKPRPPDETPKCPRCDSANTKFCYYNNYSLTQPRYFCKSCRRYWTKGGTLRNVPVGGGCRKNNKRSSSSSTSSSSPSSPSSSLTSPSMFIKRTLLAAAATSSHRDQFELQPHHQMMMMMMGGGDGSGGNNSTTGSVALHAPTTTTGILHLPFSYDHHQESNSCDLSLAFARLQQRINQQGDQFSDNRHGLENIDHDTSTIGSGGTAGGTTTTSIDSVIIAHGQQNQGSGGDQSYMVDSFRDGISYVNDHQQQHSLNNNQPDTENNNNNNGGMNSFFHNLNLLSYGLPAAHHNITVSNEQKTEDLLLPYHEMDPLSSVGAGNNTTTTTTHSAAAVTTSGGAMKHEPLWDSTDHTKLPWGLGFPWQQVMMNGDHQSGMNVGDAGETGKNWINVNGRVMNIGSLQVGMDY